MWLEGREDTRWEVTSERDLKKNEQVEVATDCVPH